MTKKNTGETAEKQGKIKVSKLHHDQEPVTELTGSEQRRIQGGAPQTKPVSARGPKPGDGGCEEWGCGANHDETLVVERDSQMLKLQAMSCQC